MQQHTDIFKGPSRSSRESHRPKRKHDRFLGSVIFSVCAHGVLLFSSTCTQVPQRAPISEELVFRLVDPDPTKQGVLWETAGQNLGSGSDASEDPQEVPKSSSPHYASNFLNAPPTVQGPPQVFENTQQRPDPLLKRRQKAPKEVTDLPPKQPTPPPETAGSRQLETEIAMAPPTAFLEFLPSSENTVAPPPWMHSPIGKYDQFVQAHFRTRVTSDEAGRFTPDGIRGQSKEDAQSSTIAQALAKGDLFMDLRHEGLDAPTRIGRNTDIDTSFRGHGTTDAQQTSMSWSTSPPLVDNSAQPAPGGIDLSSKAPQEAIAGGYIPSLGQTSTAMDLSYWRPSVSRQPLRLGKALEPVSPGVEGAHPKAQGGSKMDGVTPAPRGNISDASVPDRGVSTDPAIHREQVSQAPLEDEDPVQSFRKALGWDEADERYSRAQTKNHGHSYGSPLTATSPQIANKRLKLSMAEAVTVRGTPLGVYVDHIYKLITHNWHEQDLNPRLRLLGVQGEVHLQYKIRRNGRVADLAVLHSSGFAELDQLAIQAIPKRFPRIPRKLKLNTLDHEIILRYRNPMVKHGA